MTIATKLPAVLEFPGTRQNSISVLRALKHAREVIMDLSLDFGQESDDCVQVALDDLELMIGAVE